MAMTAGRCSCEPMRWEPVGVLRPSDNHTDALRKLARRSSDLSAKVRALAGRASLTQVVSILADTAERSADARQAEAQGAWSRLSQDPIFRAALSPDTIDRVNAATISDLPLAVALATASKRLQAQADA